MQQFKSGQNSVLIATDVAARGLDIKGDHGRGTTRGPGGPPENHGRRPWHQAIEKPGRPMSTHRRAMWNEHSESFLAKMVEIQIEILRILFGERP